MNLRENNQMELENILSQEIVQKLGWTLLHFIWQATAAALLLGILLAVLRKSSANLRYIVACAALGLIVLLPIITMQLVPVSTQQPIANIEPPPAHVIAPVQLTTEEMPLARVKDYEEPAKSESTDAASQISWKHRAVERLEPALPYLVAGWLLGVFGLSLWHLGGWAQLQRLRKKMVKQVDVSVHNKLRRLSEKLQVKRAVQLLESALVQVPTVVGWLRPVILLPASALTGLSTEQLEALLAHELAHIRRYDYLINMLQTVVETLGFYHPAVWWVSHRIRAERENCCDDLAVNISGDRIRYARALTSMEEIRAGRSDLAVAATGGNLFGRIRRLLGKEASDTSRASWIPSAITILLIAIIAIPTTLALTIKSESQESQQETEEIDPNSWQEKFYSLYRLEDGQVLKRIAPPFIPERRGFFLSVQPGRYSSNTYEELVSQHFNWDGDLSIRGARVGSGIYIPRLKYALESVIGLGNREYDIPPDILSADMSGDWIVRKDTPQEDLLLALEQIIKEETGKEIDFVKQKVKTEVIIAKGKYNFQLLPNITDGQYVLISTNKTDTYTGGGGGSGTLVEFLKWVGNRVEMNVIDETEAEGIELSWRNHNSSDLSRLNHDAEPYNQRLNLLLNNLTLQTGLTFSRKTATVEKWFISENGTIKFPQNAGTTASDVESGAKADTFDPSGPVLAESAAPSAVDKSIVKIYLSVVEVSSDSKMDSKTTAEIRNLLADKITIPDSPATADLLRKAAEATAPVKDESAGDKRVTQQQFNTLFDLLTSRGYIKILMRPTLEVVDGQTAKIQTNQDSIQITPNVLENGYIDLQIEAALSSQTIQQENEQTPIVNRREISTRIRLNPFESGIIGGIKQSGLLTESGKETKNLEAPVTEILIILTPTIVQTTSSLPKQPLSLVGSNLPGFQELQIAIRPDDLKNRKILLCFWDMQQRPSRNLIDELAKKEKEMAEKNVIVLLVHTSDIEPSTLKEWLYNHNIPFPCGSIKNDAEKVLFNWGVRAQPWLILTDQNRIVRAEGFSLEQLDEKLLEKIPNVQIESWEKSNKPLHKAVAYGDIEQVRLLLLKDANVREKDDNGLTALHVAAEYGHRNIAELLLTKDVDVNAKGSGDWTALHSAAVHGYTDLAELLIAKGADVNAKDKNGKTPLHFVASGPADLAALLISKGADVNAKDNSHGQTPLHSANADVTEILLNKGADINAKNKWGQTPLYCAAGRGSKDVVELLLAKGANVNAKDDSGNTPLHLAAEQGQNAVVEFLIAKGAHVNEKDENANTPLHKAAYQGHKDVVELLLGKGADLNMKNKWGWTPLHHAVTQGQNDVVEVLIANGADVNAQDNNGQTVLWWAENTKHKEIAELLQKHGAKKKPADDNQKTPITEETDTQVGGDEKNIKADEVVLKLVDPNSQPVLGARVGTYVDWSDIAENPPIWFLRYGRNLTAVNVKSDELGKVTLEAEELFGSGWTIEGIAPLTAIDEGHYLAGLRELTRKDLGKEVTLMLQPACRVHGRVSAATARKRKWSTKILTVYVDWQEHRPCQYSSKQGRFEFILPPGKYNVKVYSDDPDKAITLPILIKPGQRDLDLTKYLDGTNKPPAVQADIMVDAEDSADVTKKTRIVQLDCVVLEVSPALKMDKEIKNMLGDFPTMFDPPMYMSSADLLLGEAAGDKRTARERIGVLIEKLTSQGRAKMRMHPTLQLAEGQTHKFETAGNFLQVTPSIVKDGYIDMRLEATFHSKFIQEHRRQNPVTSKRSSTDTIRNRPGEILIIGSAIQIEEGPEGDNNATNSEEKTTDLVFILTPTIVDTDNEPQNEFDGPIETQQEQRSSNNLLAKSVAPSGVDRSIVKVDLSVVEVPPGPEVDRETTVKIKNLLAGKITIPDSPAVADLLRKATEATVAVKDESAGDKRVTQEQFDTLFDLLVSRGYVKILMNPTLQVVEGQTAQIKTDQNSLEVTANGVKDDIIYVHVKADLSSQSVPEGEGQKPMTSRRSFASMVRISSGQSQIIGGMIQPAARPDADSDTKVSQTPARELMCIVTASIIAPAADEVEQSERQQESNSSKAQIMIDTKILTVSDEFMKYIGLDPNSVASSEGWSDYLIHSSDDSASFVVDQLHEDLLFRTIAARMRTHNDIQMLHKPQVLVLSGKKCEIHITDSEYYMLIGPNEPNALPEESESKPNHIELGTIVRLTPTLTPDRQNVELDFEWEYRRLRGIKEHTGPDGNVQKVPQIDVDRIKTPCTVPNGKTLLIADKKITVQKKKEPKKFGLADLPLIGMFFYSPPKVEETRNLLIMVTPSTDIKAPPIPPPIDPNDPLIKKLEEKFKRETKPTN
jgi:ankyrin repeat protein/type II secretory pathway component GspD/PulD (secretin)/beta-lactamase regulating signal transducer with metallopeptidase domain